MTRAGTRPTRAGTAGPTITAIAVVSLLVLVALLGGLVVLLLAALLGASLGFWKATAIFVVLWALFSLLRL